jgi:hypothetical protein
VTRLTRADGGFQISPTGETIRFRQRMLRLAQREWDLEDLGIAGVDKVSEMSQSGANGGITLLVGLQQVLCLPFEVLQIGLERQCG